MAYIAQTVCDLAGLTLQDPAKTLHPDPERLAFLNAGLQVFALVRPDLFAQNIELATTANKVEQDAGAINPEYMGVVNIFGVKDAKTRFTECDLETLNRFTPGWRQETAGTPIHWMRYPDDPAKRDPRKYLLYVRPKTNIILNAMVTVAPSDILSGANVPLPLAYKDALAHYIVYRAESKDDEHVLSARAAQALALVERLLGVALTSKVVVKENRPA